MDTDTISIEQFAQQIAPPLAELLATRLPDSFKAANNLIELANNAKETKRNLRALHDAMAAASAAQVKLAADRAAFDEYKAKETAEIEEQRKTTVSTYATVRSRESAVAGREERCAAREAELRGGYQPRNSRHENTNFMAGSGFAQTIIEPPPVSDEPPPEQAPRTVVRVGRAGTTLSQTIEK
jgi:hypothetical protein